MKNNINIKESINGKIDKVMVQTQGNGLISDLIEEAAGNYMQNRTDDNLEIRAELLSYVKDICSLCTNAIDKVKQPDFEDMDWRDDFREESGSMFKLDWLKENMPMYFEKIKEKLGEKIVINDRTVQYFLAKIAGAVGQIYFSYYYDFDWKLLRVSEEEFIKKVMEKRNQRNHIFMPIGDDPIENQKVIEKTVNEIKGNLEREKIRKN